MPTALYTVKKVQRAVLCTQGAEKKDAGAKSPDQGVTLTDVTGYTFAGKLITVADPSRVRLATIYPWRARGVLLHELAEMSGAVGAINGGLYYQPKNSGGHPEGVAVSDGVIQYNSPGQHGLHLIGLDKSHKLRVIDLTGMRQADVERLVREEGIRDAVTFPDQHNDRSNWFVPIIEDGKERVVKHGMQCSMNPRTVIGQRADGAILMLTANGRGTSAHIGATMLDLIKVMKEHGAVTAANLDGGSSTCMYFNGKYAQPSATFYYAKASWNLPTAFVVGPPSSPSSPR